MPLCRHTSQPFQPILAPFTHLSKISPPTIMFDITRRSRSKQQEEAEWEEPQLNHWDIFRQVSRENVQLGLAVSRGNDTISELTKLLAEYNVLLTQATSIDLNADHVPSQLNKALSTGNIGLDDDSVSLLLDEPQEEEPQSGHCTVILEVKRENVQLTLALSRRNDTISELTKLLTEYDILLTQATSSDLNGNHVSKQLDEPWSTSNRGLDAHGLSLLLNDPLSLDSHRLSLLINEPRFTCSRGLDTDTVSPSCLPVTIAGFSNPFAPSQKEHGSKNYGSVQPLTFYLQKQSKFGSMVTHSGHTRLPINLLRTHLCPIMNLCDVSSFFVRFFTSTRTGTSPAAYFIR